MLTRRTVTNLGLAIAVGVTWCVVMLRIQPWPFSDYEVFLAVARRLSAGDVLYEGVWDNKDPFVYYSLALVQDLGQPALWALEALWFILASASVFAISRNYGLSRRWSLFIGVVLAPIAFIPFHYFPGTTHIPGIALSLAILATFLGARYVLSGVAVGFLFFFKLSMLPIAAVAIAVIVWRVRSLRPLVPTGIAALITFGIGSLVLVVRGEFRPYLDSLVHNFTYSQTNTESGDTGPLAIVAERLTVLSDVHVLITVITIGVILIATVTRASTTEVWLLSGATFITALLSIAVIGKFPHHAQVLSVSAALALVLLATSFSDVREARPIISAMALLVVAIALTGGPSLKGYVDSIRNPQGTWIAMTTTDPTTQDLLTSGPPRTFAIVQGAGFPRSPGLEEWQLACRHLAQRPWESDELLQESLDCFPTAHVLLVPQDFSVVGAPPAFSRFTDEVARLLSEQYTCVPGAQNTVCTRLDVTDNQ